MSQREEIETIAKRNISVNLSDADVKRIAEKAGSVGLTVAELLENFIGDLTHGTYSNGSDERDIANGWFERCGFSFMNDGSFLQYLIDICVVEEFINDYEEMKYHEENPYCKENDIHQLGEECFEEDYQDVKKNVEDTFTDFLGQLRNGQEAPKFEDEMQLVLKWWSEYKTLTD